MKAYSTISQSTSHFTIVDHNEDFSFSLLKANTQLYSSTLAKLYENKYVVMVIDGKKRYIGKFEGIIAKRILKFPTKDPLQEDSMQILYEVNAKDEDCKMVPISPNSIIEFKEFDDEYSAKLFAELGE